MVKKSFIWIVLTASLVASTLTEKVQSLLDEKSYHSHRKLIALLFEDEAAYRTDTGYDMVKIATVLKENGLLHLKLPSAATIELIFEQSGGNPLFFMKAVGDTLHNVGISSFLTKRAALDEQGFTWSVVVRSDVIPDPVRIAERFEKRLVKTVDIERIDATHWRYRIDMLHAKIDAIPIEAGEIKKVVRPVRPVWIDVSRVRRLAIRELPGAHWHSDVVVYDKMLHILSMKQSDARTRYVRLRLPKDAAYVKISDRFTLENLRSGLRLDAQGER